MTLNFLSLTNLILTLAVHDINGAEESTVSDPSELEMDKRNIASVAREFYGSYKPGSRYDSTARILSHNMYRKHMYTV